MAIDFSAARSRRNLLTAVGAAIAGAAAATVAGAQAVLAAGNDGQVIRIGNFYADVRSQTYLENKTNSVAVFTAASRGGTSISGDSSYGGTGVVGTSGSGIGVYGGSTVGPGVHGSSRYAAGVFARSEQGPGVRALSDGNNAVRAETNDNDAIFATSTSKAGVFGASTSGPGLYGQSDSNYGVGAYSNNGVGVWAASPDGRGGVFGGKKAQIQLTPFPVADHPAGGQTGDLFVDQSARLWFCVDGGNPATWKQVQLV